MAHGGGGELTHQLINNVIIKRLSNQYLDLLTDSAILDVPKGQICFTTDSYVVKPLEFPGGDIGMLAVCGTVNDLAVMGAEPVALSLGLIIEEGFSVSRLESIVDSISKTAKLAGVKVATGDTKVIEAVHGDGLYINTSGVGILRHDVNVGPDRIEEGDAIIITGYIAEHGLAVMCCREGLSLDTQLKSDVAPLNSLIKELLDSGADIKFMRDPTRGGLSGVLVDITNYSGMGVVVEETLVPLKASAKHVAELLGLDPLAVANEGKCVIVSGPDDAEMILALCREHSLGKNASIIGRVCGESNNVELETGIGGRRIIQRPYGEQLPRIC